MSARPVSPGPLRSPRKIGLEMNRPVGFTGETPEVQPHAGDGYKPATADIFSGPPAAPKQPKPFKDVK